jgi:hypothetical protein
MDELEFSLAAGDQCIELDCDFDFFTDLDSRENIISKCLEEHSYFY